LALIFYFSRKRQATTKIAAWIVGSLARLSRGRWKFERLKHSAEKMLKAFHDGIDTLIAQKSRLVLPVSLSIFAWALDLLISVFVFQALDALRSFSLIAIVYSISVAIQTIPIGVPGEVGVLDIVMTSLYTLLGGGYHHSRRCSCTDTHPHTMATSTHRRADSSMAGHQRLQTTKHNFLEHLRH
jgi:uncharacterized protein (TIRG00374 family)